MSARRLQVFVVLFCAATLLLAQLTGVHYHRHIGHHDAGHDHAVSYDDTGPGTTVHLRDAGVHMAADEGGAHAHSAGDRASHPGVDLEIDLTVDSLTKVFKSSLFAGVLLAFLALLCWIIVAPARVVGFLPRRTQPQWRRFSLFALRPPSHAPPAFLVRA
jgi:hypothetical protein